MDPKQDNPFAAPVANVDGPKGAPFVPHDDGMPLGDAIDALNDYLADPANVAADEALQDPYVKGMLRVGFVVCSAGFAVVLGMYAALGMDSFEVVIAAILSGVCVFVMGLGVGTQYYQGHQTGVAADTTDPGFALWRHLRATGFARYGSALTGLTPRARMASIRPPDLSPVVTGVGSFSWLTPGSAKTYAQTFAVPGNGQYRHIKLKSGDYRSAISPDNPNVAFATVEVQFLSWPQWAMTTTLVLFVVIRLIGIIVGLGLWFSLKQTTTVTVTRTLIRGNNGRWYLHSASLLEVQEAD